MDRNTILSISRIVHLNFYHSVPKDDAYTITVEYMKEKGITDDKIDKFITTIDSHPELYGTMLGDCFLIALQYFESKYSIFKLYDKRKKLIAIY